jgi:hypothetical protein
MPVERLPLLRRRKGVNSQHPFRQGISSYEKIITLVYPWGGRIYEIERR